jgi:hypothetical protein
MLPIQSGDLERETEIPVYEGMSVYEMSVYEGMSVYEMAVYEGMSVHEEMSVYEIAVYEGMSVYEMAVYEGMSVHEGGMLSRSQTQADTVSALLDKARGISETVLSLVEIQSDTESELNDENRCGSYDQNRKSIQEGQRGGNVHSLGEIAETHKSQQGGPRPGCTWKDQRPCQSDFPKATGAGLGKTTPLRTLSLSKSSNVTEIWEEAERRLGADRGNFSLVYSGHKLLPASGTLDHQEQLFEIRWRGRGEVDRFRLRARVNGREWEANYPTNMTLQDFLKAHDIPDASDRLVSIGNFQFEGPLTEPIDRDERVYDFYPPSAADEWIKIDLEEDRSWDIVESYEELYQIHSEEGKFTSRRLRSIPEGMEEEDEEDPYAADDDEQIDYENDEDWDTRMEDPSKIPVLFECGDNSFWDSMDKEIPLDLGSSALTAASYQGGNLWQQLGD